MFRFSTSATMASSPLRQEVIFSSSDSESTDEISDSESSPPRPDVMTARSLASQPSKNSTKTAFLAHNSLLDEENHLAEYNFFNKEPCPAAKPAFSEEDLRWLKSFESAVWPLLAAEKHQIETFLSFAMDAISTAIPKYPPGLIVHNTIAEHKGGVDELLAEAKEKIGDLKTEMKTLMGKIETRLVKIETLERVVETFQGERGTGRVVKRPRLAWQRIEDLEESETW